MARFRGSRFPRSTQGSRRQTSWNEGVFGVTPVLSGTGPSMVATGQQATEDGLTLIRVRGHVTIDVTAVPLLSANFFRLAMGLCIVSENAAGVGITAVPQPLTDIGWDGWLWHWTGIAGVVPGTVRSTVGGVVSVEVDSKAMRKFKLSDILVGVIEVVETGDAGTIITQWQTRILAKLS